MAQETLEKQVDRKLNGLMRAGESRHKAKAKAREEYAKEHGGQNPSMVELVVPTIHSYKTLSVYKEHCERFARWCVENGKCGKYARLDKIEKYAVEYLETKQAQGLSPYSLASMKSALCKLYGERIEYTPPAQYTHAISRSRGVAARDRHFSEENNKKLITIARATGGRRADLAKLKPSDFKEIDGRLWVSFEQSKGGRDRMSPVLPRYAQEVREILATAEKDKPLFDKIHSAADIHSYRREYCRAMYKAIRNNKKFRENVERQYPARRETNVKSPYYIAADGSKYWRDDVHLCSQALGHNRLNTTVEHYLTED